MARNRKRAKDRRPRRPPGGSAARPGVATARAERDQTPSPIEHAAPDVELADAQLALGRPELAGDPEFSGPESADGDLGDDGDFGPPDSADPTGGGGASGGGDLTRGSAGSPAPRELPGNRLVNFLQGSWRELQRVQWPDRRQVMQATGVVIGFVIVAGVFLGVADALATKVVTLILK